jgi:hypothetical protein
MPLNYYVYMRRAVDEATKIHRQYALLSFIIHLHSAGLKSRGRSGRKEGCVILLPPPTTTPCSSAGIVDVYYMLTIHKYKHPGSTLYCGLVGARHTPNGATRAPTVGSEVNGFDEIRNDGFRKAGPAANINTSTATLPDGNRVPRTYGPLIEHYCIMGFLLRRSLVFFPTGSPRIIISSRPRSFRVTTSKRTGC